MGDQLAPTCRAAWRGRVLTVDCSGHRVDQPVGRRLWPPVWQQASLNARDRIRLAPPLIATSDDLAPFVEAWPDLYEQASRA